MPFKKAAKKAAASAKAHAPIKELSSYVTGLSKMLGGSRGRAYKSCIFGTGKARPKAGHVARCNRRFFGSPKVKLPKKARSAVAAAKGRRIRVGQGGAQRRRVGAGPGQRGAPAKRRRTEGR